MTIETFLSLLSMFAVLTGLATQVLKKLNDNPKSNFIAFISALIIGTGGTLVYYQLTSVAFTINNIIYAVLLGLASALVAMLGYDKIKQAIEQICNTK